MSTARRKKRKKRPRFTYAIKYQQKLYNRKKINNSLVALISFCATEIIDY